MRGSRLLFFGLGCIVAATCAFFREYNQASVHEAVVDCEEQAAAAPPEPLVDSKAELDPGKTTPTAAPPRHAGVDPLHTNESPTLNDRHLPPLVNTSRFPLLERNCSSFCVDLVPKCGTSTIANVLNYPHDGHHHFIRNKRRLTVLRNGTMTVGNFPCECRFGLTRDPIDRLISAFEFDKAHSKFSGPFHEFITKGMSTNPYHFHVYESYIGGPSNQPLNISLVLSAYDLLIPIEYLTTVSQFLRLRVTELEPLPYVPLEEQHSSGIPAHKYPMDALAIDTLAQYVHDRALDTQLHQLARALARPMVLEMDEALRRMHEDGRTYL